MTNDQTANNLIMVVKYRLGKQATRRSDDEELFWEGVDAGMILNDAADSLRRIYDLQERTAKFGESTIDFALTIPKGPVTNRLIDQLVGAGTSVGANYCEADDAYSRNEFRKHIAICKKEARETKFHLRMIVRAVPELKPAARILWQEAKELHLIFCTILRKTPREK